MLGLKLNHVSKRGHLYNWYKLMCVCVFIVSTLVQFIQYIPDILNIGFIHTFQGYFTGIGSTIIPGYQWINP